MASANGQNRLQDPRVPRGSPIADRPEDAGEVHASDVARARAQWRRDAPPLYADLLDAPEDHTLDASA